MRSLLAIRADAIVVVLMLMFFGLAGAIPGIAPNQADEMTGATGSALQTAVGLGTQAVVDAAMLLWMVKALPVWGDASRRLDRLLLLFPVALGVWAVLSIGWSHDVPLSLRRAGPFCTETFFGVFLALRYSGRSFLRMLVAAFAILAAWSAVLALGFPSVGLDASTGHGGDWQGVFTQKNACGRAMVFALAATLCADLRPSARCGLLLLFTAELVLSGSRGAWLLGAITLCVLVVVFAAARLERKLRAAWFVGIGSSAVSLAFLGYTQFAQLAPAMGRDATLSGRTGIWQQVWLAIMRHPVLGYGFAGFWHGYAPPSWDVVAALGFVLFHAHNGFLEIWLELGVLGLLLFTAGYLRATLLLWKQLLSNNALEAAWPCAVLFLALLYDLDENTLLSFNGLFWLLYVSAATRIELLAQERRRADDVYAATLPRAIWIRSTTAQLKGNSATGEAWHAGHSPWL